jgi:hypothetical protein
MLFMDIAKNFVIPIKICAIRDCTVLFSSAFGIHFFGFILRYNNFFPLINYYHMCGFL